MRHKKQDTKICIAFGIDLWRAREGKGGKKAMGKIRIWEDREKERGKEEQHSHSWSRSFVVIPFYSEFCLCNSSRNCLNSKIAASQLWLQTNCRHAQACRTAGNDNRQAAILDVDTQRKQANLTGLTLTVKASWQTDRQTCADMRDKLRRLTFDPDAACVPQSNKLSHWARLGLACPPV